MMFFIWLSKLSFIFLESIRFIVEFCFILGCDPIFLSASSPTPLLVEFLFSRVFLLIMLGLPVDSMSLEGIDDGGDFFEKCKFDFRLLAKIPDSFSCSTSLLRDEYSPEMHSTEKFVSYETLKWHNFG